MRNRTIIIRLFFLFCFAVFPSAYAQDMSFNYLTTDNGLSQFTVYALYNDEWGQIWIGTRDGLNVYNGNRIKTYKEEKGNPTTLLGRTVRRICGNGKGLIYVLTTEGVSELDMKTETFTHISDKQKEWMTAITYCDGKLFMGTYGRIYEREETTGIQTPYCTFPGQVLDDSGLAPTTMASMLWIRRVKRNNIFLRVLIFIIFIRIPMKIYGFVCGIMVYTVFPGMER